MVDLMDCQSCRGQGEVQVHEECMECDGTGTVTAWRSCRICGGTGHPLEQDDPEWQYTAEYQALRKRELKLLADWGTLRDARKKELETPA